MMIKPASTALVRTPRSSKRSAASIAPLHLKHILVPVDFSTFLGRALRQALALASTFNAEVLLLHVIELFPIDYMVGAKSGTFTGAEGRRRAKDDLERMAQELIGTAQVRHRCVVRLGRPFRRTGLERAYLGSTAERVVRHAVCPVLIVRKR